MQPVLPKQLLQMVFVLFFMVVSACRMSTSADVIPGTHVTVS